LQQQQNCDDGEIEEATRATRRFQEKKQSVNLNSLMAEIKFSSCEPRVDNLNENNMVKTETSCTQHMELPIWISALMLVQ